MIDKDQVQEALKNVNYPGFSKDIVSVGAIENIVVAPGLITVSMKTIAADDAALKTLKDEIHREIVKVDGSSEINVIMKGGLGAQEAPAPAGQHDSPFVREKLPGVDHIIPVISGKGGVGKSTIAVNIAHTLAKQGHKVGILDLDIFGPSTHRMLGVKDRLMAHDNSIIPSEAHGMKIVSIGMGVEDDEALVLRGPMVMKLINQLIGDVQWGELDYLIVDMPPGTGDVPLSLAQKVAIAGAVVVTTPQDISLIDVRRAVAMFRQTDTRILGLVENMSHYVCEKCGDVAHIFGSEGGLREAEKQGLPLLGKVPLTKSICERAESGSPIIDDESSPELAKIFEELANKIIAAVAEKQDTVASRH